MKLIVGLGNPGSKYQQTRHNVGFMVLKNYGKNKNIIFKFESKFNAMIANFKYNQEKIILMMPSTYMNLSGQAISSAMKYYDIDIKDLLVFVDDIHLSVAKLRLREKGGHGGHNGLRHIISMLHDQNFKRVRIGVGNNPKLPLDHFVLGKFSKAEMKRIEKAINDSTMIIDYFIENMPYTDIMTRFNTQT